MITEHSRLAFDFAKNIFCNTSIDIAIHKTLVSEKKHFSNLYETQKKGARIFQRDLHSKKYHKESSDFAYRMFSSSIVKQFLDWKIFGTPGVVNAEISTLLTANLDAFFLIVEQGKAVVYAENSNGTGYEISCDDIKSILVEKVPFKSFAKDLLDGIDERYEPIPDSISISGDEIVVFCEKALDALELNLLWSSVFEDVSNYYKELYNDKNEDFKESAGIASDLNSQNNLLLKKYATKIAGYTKILSSGLQMSLMTSVDAKALLHAELSIVDNILLNGVFANKNLAVNNWSSFLKIESKTLQSIYVRLIQGVELEMIEAFVDALDMNGLYNLALCKAFIHYKEILNSKLSVKTKTGVTEKQNASEKDIVVNMINSRYDKVFSLLLNKINLNNQFTMVFNEDKLTYHLPYLYDNYKN